MTTKLSITYNDLITLNHACGMCPRRRGGKKPHVATLHRWATNGCRGVRLETICVGATRCTSPDAIDRFFARFTEMRDVSNAIVIKPATNQPDPAEVDRELNSEGL